MNDYAVAPVQPIVQGLVYADLITGVMKFYGAGVRRFTPISPGVYKLELDPGVPGTGELAPVPPGLTAPAGPDPRTIITLRGITTTVTAVLVGYGQSAPPPLDNGLNVILVTLQAPVPVDQNFEIITWLGVNSGPVLLS